MRTLTTCVGLLIACSAAVSQELTFKHNQDVIHLSSRRCTSQVILRAVPMEYREHFLDAITDVDGQVVRACWMRVPSGEVIILYEDGAYGLLPYELFQPDL